MEAGILDFRKMVITILKSSTRNKNQKPFTTEIIKLSLPKEELNNELLSIDNNNTELAEFTDTVLSILDKYASI